MDGFNKYVLGLSQRADPELVHRKKEPKFGEWQLIKTAPTKNLERIILGKRNSWVCEGYYRNDGTPGWVSCMDPDTPWPLEPTDWMPLPDPPGER